MIKLFRKIRKSMIKDNRIGKYLLYAIGETLLVIIGILIALSINNKNQLRQNEVKVISIFKEIQKDLLVDIAEANKILEVEYRIDSLANLVLNSQLTAEDYNSNIMYFYLITQEYNMNFSDNAYNNLIREVDKIPNKYKDVLDDLNILYLTEKKEIQIYNDVVAEFINKLLYKWSQSHTWYANYIRMNYDEYDEEVVSFFLTDPFYKNDVAHYQMLLTGNHIYRIERFKYRAVVSYMAIAKFLEPEKDLPDLITSYGVMPLSDVKLQNYVGSYSSNPDTQKDLINISVKEGNLIMSTTRYDFEFYPKSDFSFYSITIPGSYYIVFNKDEQDHVLGFTSYYKDNQNTYFLVTNETENETKE